MDAMFHAGAGTPNADFGNSKEASITPGADRCDAGGVRAVNPSPPSAPEVSNDDGAGGDADRGHGACDLSLGDVGGREAVNDETTLTHQQLQRQGGVRHLGQGAQRCAKSQPEARREHMALCLLNVRLDSLRPCGPGTQGPAAA